MVTQGEALWREGEKPHQPRTASAITDAIVRAGFFSGHSTPWKRGGSCCASHSPLRGESLTGVEKPFRSFSERLITWYSSTLHLSAWTEDLGHGGPTPSMQPGPMCSCQPLLYNACAHAGPQLSRSPYWADSKTKLITTVKTKEDVSHPTLTSYFRWLASTWFLLGLKRSL